MQTVGNTHCVPVQMSPDELQDSFIGPGPPSPTSPGSDVLQIDRGDNVRLPPNPNSLWFCCMLALYVGIKWRADTSIRSS